MGEKVTFPVFTTPAEQITFYADEPSTYRQVLTIMNPCQFAVCYQVLIQASVSSKFSIDLPCGKIKPKNLVSIIIRHNYITTENAGVIDKLKIIMMSKKPGVTFSKKELSLILLSTREVTSDIASSFDSFPSHPFDPRSSYNPRQQHVAQEKRNESEVDLVKKFQGYIIAFMLGVFACYFWKS